MKPSFRSSSVPLAVLALCIVSFGLVITQVGWYWDDWFYAYFIHFFNPSDFWEAFQEDRPLAAGLYALTSSLIGEQTLHWQIFVLFARWLAGLAVWWMLKALWPGKPRQVAIVTLLFVIYPGFRQQHIAILYSNWLIVLAMFAASLGCMLWAMRLHAAHKPGPAWLLFLLSLPLSGYAMSAVEYFYGLELLRPALLWLVDASLMDKTAGAEDLPRPRWSQRLRRVGLYWIPYLAIMLGFLAWRMANQTTRGTITLLDNLAANPIKTVIDLAVVILRDVFKVSVQAWGQVLDFSKLSDYGWTVILGSGLLIVITAALAIFYLARIEGQSQEAEGQSHRIAPTGDDPQAGWAWQAIWLGIYALLLGGIPFWTTSLQIMLNFPRDRFTMSMMLGAAWLVAGLIELVSLPFTQRVERKETLTPAKVVPAARRLPYFPLMNVTLAGILLGLAAGMHFQVGLEFRKEWMAQRDFFWQLVWRAPGLQPGTAIMTTEMPFPYDSDHSLSAALHWTYAPDYTSRELTYFYYNIESHLSRGLDTLTEDTPINIQYRLLHFKGSLAQAVLVIYRPPACLKVIDPHIDQNLPAKPRFFREALPFSDPSLIVPDASPAAQPPNHLFGPEPEHGWCYAFQKADLARQQGDWQQVVELGDQALKKKRFDRNSAAELTPFIEGYAHVGQWDRAVQLSLDAYQAWANMRLMLCTLWSDIAQTTPTSAEQQAALSQIQGKFSCQTSP